MKKLLSLIMGILMVLFFIVGCAAVTNEKDMQNVHADEYYIQKSSTGSTQSQNKQPNLVFEYYPISGVVVLSVTKTTCNFDAICPTCGERVSCSIRNLDLYANGNLTGLLPVQFSGIAVSHVWTGGASGSSDTNGDGKIDTITGQIDLRKGESPLSCNDPSPVILGYKISGIDFYS